MPDEPPLLLPDPGTLRVGAPPYAHGVPGIVALTLTQVIAAAAAVLAGVVLFGWAAIRVLAISVAVALLVESAFNLLTRRTRSWSESHALLTGLLLACTLPATVPWQVVVAGSAIAIMVGQALLGGVGNYLWHPVALARVLLQVLFHEELSPGHWPVLAPGHLFWGDLTQSAALPPLGHWSSHEPLPGVHAWEAVPPVAHLLGPVPAAPGAPASQALADLVRDTLPPWTETLAGGAGGAIGEACAIALMLAGLLLLWRGILRWPMVIAALGSAAILAAVLPVRIQAENAPAVIHWLPGAAMWQGLPVGLVYVCYHLTAGGLLLVVTLLAADPSSSPLTARGHVLFGLVIGTVAILLRVRVGVPAAEYWALLAANTLVPAINRLTRRRVLGT